MLNTAEEIAKRNDAWAGELAERIVDGVREGA